MQYYHAKIRLAGSPMNEVQKILSAPEVLILQYVHGVDAITNVTFHEEKRINLREEKERLKSMYDQALVKREQSIDTIFGPLGSVPERLPEDLMERFGMMVDSDDVLEVVKSVTASDKRENHSQTMTQNEQDRIDRVIPAEQVALADLAG